MKAVAALIFFFFAVLAVCSAAEPAKETLKGSAASYYGAYPYAAYGAYPYSAGYHGYASPYHYGAYAYSGYPYAGYPYYY